MNATARRLLQRNREANLSTVALMRRWETITQEIRPVPQPRPVKVRAMNGTARYLNGAPGTVPFPTVAPAAYTIPSPVETTPEESPAMSRETAAAIRTPAAAAAVSIVPTVAPAAPASPAPQRAPRVRMADILEVMRDTNVQTAATLTALRESAAAADTRLSRLESMVERLAGVVLPPAQPEARRSTGNVTGSQRTAAARAARAANVAARRQTAPAATVAPVQAAPVQTARPARAAAPVAAADVSYVQLLKGKNAAGNVMHSGQIAAAVYIVSWNAAAGVWDYSLTVGARTLVSGAVKGRNNAFAAVNSAAAKAGVRQVCAAS